MIEKNFKDFECEYFKIEKLREGELKGFCAIVILENGVLDNRRVLPFETFIVPKGEKAKLQAPALVMRIGKFLNSGVIKNKEGVHQRSSHRRWFSERRFFLR